MVSTNTFQRVLTHVLLPIAAIYLLLVGLNVTKADIEYVADKPTLSSRTPPFIPGERFLFRREAKDQGDDSSDGDSADDSASQSDLKKVDTKHRDGNNGESGAESGATNGSAKKENDDDDQNDDQAKSEKVSKTTKKPENDDENEANGEEESDEEKANEGSRMGFSFGLKQFDPFNVWKKNRKKINVGPDKDSAGNSVAKTTTHAPTDTTTIRPTIKVALTAAPKPATTSKPVTTPTSSPTKGGSAPNPASATVTPRPATTPAPTKGGSSTAAPSTAPTSIPDPGPTKGSSTVSPVDSTKPPASTSAAPKSMTTPVPTKKGSSATAASTTPAQALNREPTKKADPVVFPRGKPNHEATTPAEGLNVANKTTKNPPTGKPDQQPLFNGWRSTTKSPSSGDSPIGASTSTVGPKNSTPSPSKNPKPPMSGASTVTPVPTTTKIPGSTIGTTRKMNAPESMTTSKSPMTTPNPKVATTSGPKSSTSVRPMSSLKPSTTKSASASASTSTRPTSKILPTGSASPAPSMAPKTTALPPKSLIGSTLKPSQKSPTTTINPTKKPTNQASTKQPSTVSAKPTTKGTATTLPTMVPSPHSTTPPQVHSTPILAPPIPTQVSNNSTNEVPVPNDNSTALDLNQGPTVIHLKAPIPMNSNPDDRIINGAIHAPDQKPPAAGGNPNITYGVPNRDADLLINFNMSLFDVRDVAYFLESHPAHSIHDPRVYFTSERTTRSLVILSRELKRVPERLRFAYMIRVFNELGRKLASKLNYYAVELVSVLKKSPDQLGNKPEVSQLVDAINNAFESKDDTEIDGPSEFELEYDTYVTRIIESSKDTRQVFRAAMSEISNRFAQLISYFVLEATSVSSSPPKDGQPAIKIPPGGQDKLPILLGESLKHGAKSFMLETAYDDRFRIPLDAIGYTNLILNDTISSVAKRLKNKDMNVSESIRRDFDESMNVNSYKDLNSLSDKIGLLGSWNSFLFSNLGTAERLVKIFASLLGRVPTEVKARWLNMYMTQVHTELERTISGFVVMQGMPYHGDESEKFLLNPEKTIELIPNKVPTIRDNYLADKNRVPARCYLAGRRWRLVLSRGLDKFEDKELVIDSIANKIGNIRNRMMDSFGNDIYRLCLPRLEVGVRGWTIDGQPEGGITNENMDKFPIKNPIEGLTEMRDPFASGVELGFGIGVRVGYNEERNATLEMEQANHLQIGPNAFNETLGVNEIKYVAMASYRRAATVGSKKAFEIAVREGYLASLKISVRAGMNIPVETGSRISALKCVSFAGQAGQEAGKSAAEAFLVERRISTELKNNLIKVGQTHGLLAGEIAGESIGSIVGKAAAEEAYRRSIIRGGKVARAKFHIEEFEAGGKLGFDYGVREGKRIASSSTLDPSAPRFFRLPKPVFSAQDKPDNEVDHWEKELIPPLTGKIIADLASVRDHTPVRGTLKGKYKVAKEVKKGLKRVSYSNVTYDLEVYAEGFIKNSIAYLSLNGTVNKMGVLKGSLIARDIFNDDQDQ